MQWNKEQYLSLSTRKRDGSRVETPVWFAKEGEFVYIFSEGSAWKVKRIRNFSDVLMSPCTVTGKITGDAVKGEAEILSEASDIKEAYQALLRKYGWKLRLLDMGSRLAGKINKRVFIRIQL